MRNSDAETYSLSSQQQRETRETTGDEVRRTVGEQFDGLPPQCAE